MTHIFFLRKMSLFYGFTTLEENMNMLVLTVVIEEGFREPREKEVKLVRGLLRMYGKAWHSLPADAAEFCKLRGIKKPSDAVKYMKIIKPSLSMSRNKQRFAVYLHNALKAKLGGRTDDYKERKELALKSHLVITEACAEVMETFSENQAKMVVRFDNANTAGTCTHLPRNESGYLQFCEEMTKTYDWRMSLLALLDL